MPDRQYYDLIPIVMIQGNVGSMSELNHPLAEFWRHFFEWAANLRVPGQRLYALPDGLNGALGGTLALGRQKIMETGNVQQSGVGPL